jgi:hypothetical protein
VRLLAEAEMGRIVKVHYALCVCVCVCARATVREELRASKKKEVRVVDLGGDMDGVQMLMPMCWKLKSLMEETFRASVQTS